MTTDLENLWPTPPTTPDWIAAHIKAGPHGGWAHPIYLDGEHPLVVEDWECFICDKGFEMGQVGIVTPYKDEDWVAYHRDFCFTDNLGIERTPLLRYLAGVGTDGAGRNLETVLGFTNTEMEKVHDWVQWAFPLPEPSKFQNSPLLTPWDIKRLQEDERLKANVAKLVNLYLAFLASTTDWLAPRDHNHLRITRLIRFLTLIDQPDEAYRVYFLACEAMRETGFDFEQSHWHWTEAKKAEPAFLTPR